MGSVYGGKSKGWGRYVGAISTFGLNEVYRAILHEGGGKGKGPGGRRQIAAAAAKEHNAKLPSGRAGHLPGVSMLPVTGTGAGTGILR